MKRKIFTVLVFPLLLTVACIHKTGGAVTPWERVHTYNAALADANNAVERGAEVAVSSGLLQPAQAVPIINMAGRVALLHQQVTSILATGTASTANVASVKAVIDQIKFSLQTLPPSALGIKNPKSQKTFQQDIASIGTLADAILTALQAVASGGPTSSMSPIVTAPALHGGGN